MKITVEQAVSAAPVLREINAADISIAAAYHVGNAVKETQSIIDKYLEKRSKLLSKYGKPKEDDPNVYEFPEEGSAEKFRTSVQKLLEETVNVHIKPIKISLIKDDMKISAGKLSTVMWLFTGFEELEA